MSRFDTENVDVQYYSKHVNMCSGFEKKMVFMMKLCLLLGIAKAHSAWKGCAGQHAKSQAKKKK